MDYNYLKYEFGEYVQIHVIQPFTNNMKSRTVGAIALDPQNVPGQYSFMSLETCSKIDARVFAHQPLTNGITSCDKELGLEQKQHFRILKMLKYEWQAGSPVDLDDSTIQENT